MVPSGTKLMVTISGCGQALPDNAYGTIRDSSDSNSRRARRGVDEERGRSAWRNNFIKLSPCVKEDQHGSSGKLTKASRFFEALRGKKEQKKRSGRWRRPG